MAKAGNIVVETGEPEKKRVNGRRRLTKADVARIVTLVRHWPEMPMTWETITEAVGRDVRKDGDKKVGMQIWSRQALSSHKAIKDAYQARRAELMEQKEDAPKARRSKDPEIVMLRKENDALKLEITVLRETVSEYENRFATMVHNRALGAQTEEAMLKPLKPKLDRQGREK